MNTEHLPFKYICKQTDKKQMLDNLFIDILQKGDDTLPTVKLDFVKHINTEKEKRV